jgi:FkbM family methyltransferase
MISASRRIIRDSLPHWALVGARDFWLVDLFPFVEDFPFMRRFLRKYGLAIDVGANVGIYTRAMAKLSGDVVAIEPNPACARHLRSTSPKNVTIFEAALSDHEGEAILTVPSDGNAESHALGRVGRLDGVHYNIELVTLDKLAERLPKRPLTFIKMDVEGHELSALKGAHQTLRSHAPVLLVEVVYGLRETVEMTFEFLWSLGYSSYVLRNAVMEKSSPDLLWRAQSGQEPYVCNVFFFPQHEGKERARFAEP